ncbi:MAG: PilT/PilU family type 4a pilus ATPase [Lentisphaerae bacterium]|nr:PilT/PilU family type 4a pilus ATPase [Lentisphaerota bacterium]
MTLLQQILRAAVEAGASDIHLKPGQVPIYRIHGNLTNTDAAPLSDEQMQAMADEILPAHAAPAFEINHECDFSHHEPDAGRFRVNLFLAQNKPCIVLRHVKTDVPDFETLRLPQSLKALAATRRGIILVCGTTGSGKSTTLAALINEINLTQRRRIITIEDPIEYVFVDRESVITQREVGIDTMSYQEALVHLMRQDPDVVLIGEMRDQSSIRTALLAAQTGHLVLSSLHASTSSQAIPRILDMFPSSERSQIRQAIAQTQQAIICQRMLRDVNQNFIPSVEILVNTPTVRKLIETDRLDVLEAAIETGEKDGMQTFNRSIYEMIRTGTITEEQGMRFAGNPESLKMNLKGIFLDEGSRILSDL